jgi:hypothetical protein
VGDQPLDVALQADEGVHARIIAHGSDRGGC